jgi:gliding motility-associated-like protein
VHPLPTPNRGIDRGICIGDTLVLDPGSFNTYLWQDGSTNNTYATSFISTYFVKVTNQFGCVAADTMQVIKIYNLPANFLPPDTSLCRGNIVEVRLKNYTSYNWSTGSTSNGIDISKNGTYSVAVIDKYGCKGSDSMSVLYYECYNIRVPNTFTPNGDGKNEVFKPSIPAPVSKYQFQIANRWGQILFKTNNYKEGWDGRFKLQLQPPDTYVYSITLIDVDGQFVKRTGTFILIR